MSEVAAKRNPKAPQGALAEAIGVQYEAQEALRRVEARIEEHRRERWELERAIEEARRVGDSARVDGLLAQRQPIEVERELQRNRSEALLDLRSRAAHVDSLVRRAQGLRQAIARLRVQLAPGGYHDWLIRDTEQQLEMFRAGRAADERSLSELTRQIEELVGTTEELGLPKGLETLQSIEAALGQ